MTPKVVVKKKVEVKEPFPGYKKISTANDIPTAAGKKREMEMIEDLSKEDFFGDKAASEKMKKMGQKAIKERKNEEAVKKMNKLIAAKMRAKKP